MKKILIWKLNNTLLKNKTKKQKHTQKKTHEPKKSQKKLEYIQINEDEIFIIISKCWDIAAVLLKRKCTVFNTYVKKEQRPQINDLSLHVNKLEIQQ